MTRTRGAKGSGVAASMTIESHGSPDSRRNPLQSAAGRAATAGYIQWIVDELAGALDDAGGVGAARESGARLRSLLDAELLPLAFEAHATGIDRLRARGLAFPEHALADTGELRPPIGAAHPLRVAARVAALGGRPADEQSLAEHEDAVLAGLEAEASAGAPAVSRPHDDPDPARRAARRILQRLHGMGKWGGYHTDFKHLARGFAGNDRALAEAVGESLLDAGLLVDKPSVGQRHVFLNPRRAADIHALIERAEVPGDLRLP